MECRHFGECGSCTLYDMGYSEQIEMKMHRATELLSPFYLGDLEFFPSPDEHYRARAEFRVWHDGERCDYAMGRLNAKGAVVIGECPKVSIAIEKRMWPLIEKINGSDTLKNRLFSVEFLSASTDECLITMLYHRKLDALWQSEAMLLQEELECAIIGRSRKQKVTLGDDFVTERLEIEGREIVYRQHDGAFTQPNPAVDVKMIEWAASQVKGIGGDMLESYCGIGNFTIPLSGYFDRVLATEISKHSIKAARINCELNDVENIEFVRLSSEEMVRALRREREFRRLEGIDIDSYCFSTALVDPPRAGLDSGTLELISGIDNILYISCNLETLARDLAGLCSTHRVVSAAIFDQFPHTEHTEGGVFLRRISL